MLSIQKICKVLKPVWHQLPPVVGFDIFDLVEESIGCNLPADFKFFYQFFSNGGEGDLAGGYLRLYPAEELLPRQKDYPIDEVLPARFLIGVEGDDAFFFNLSVRSRAADYQVEMVSLAALEESAVEVVGYNFASFLQCRMQYNEQEQAE